METTLLHQEEGSKGELQLMHNENVIARMTYSKVDPQNIIVDHTSVEPTFKGQGIGKKIVEELVYWARNNGIKVLPLCTFAKATLEKQKEWSDILR
jgi:predicted GNAT family acetyltransferase